ncbi:hypothetical protein QR680_009210 [Steinernema hermaphroditum]|uniref:beta-ketoacyl-[acyl-carrier-protein] synthase I n=1 Tax=Steinernema hermaphroditum TaxID=289476 RepID=A0AA39IJH1_9BILA|nr:hypothetical protein QR680_009210 [Steinernema hermaphroditum]
MRHRVVISGLGALSPFGVGMDALWNGLKASRSALKFSGKLGAVVGEVVDFPSERWSRGEQREMSRGSQIALLAAEECLRDAKLEDDAENTGVNIGMGIADLEMIEETAGLIREGKAKRVTPYFVPRILTNMPAGYVSMKYGFKGGNMSSTTACATGASCVGDAATMVSLGRVRRMVAGAVESCVNPIAVTGFNRLRALARGLTEDVCRPFDKTREGFVLSEGGAVVLLERLEDALVRGSPIYAEVVGYGVSSDAYHLTSPDESGIGGQLCMTRCLEDSKIDAGEVSYVNAHATSTPMGDRIEARSIASVCPSVATSSIKGHIGHCLAGAGSIEIAATALMVREGRLIGNLNLGDSDVTEDVRLLRTNEEWNATGRRVALVNSFGFGGANVSVSLAQM